MGEKRKILSIDDSAIMRKMLKGAVGFLDFELLEASDGSEGITVLSHTNVDLILLDWNMPGMSGIDFLTAVKKNPSYAKIPIIMVTTEAEKANIVKAIQLGVKNYILKPFSDDELRQKIKQCLGG